MKRAEYELLWNHFHDVYQLLGNRPTAVIVFYNLIEKKEGQRVITEWVNYITLVNMKLGPVLFYF